MNKVICIFKLELKDEGMKRIEQELLERGEGNESWGEEPADQQANDLEDEFDQEFWIKVSNFFEFLNNFSKNLNGEFGLCDIYMK